MYISQINQNSKLLILKGINRKNTNSKIESKSEFRNFELRYPSSAYYTHNINFKGNYKLKKLPKEELETMQRYLRQKVIALGERDFEIPNFCEANFATQAVVKLINHPIMGKANLVGGLGGIYGALFACPQTEQRNAEAMLKFIDFLTEKDIENVVDNHEIKQCLGSTIAFVNHDDVEYKINFIKYLAANPELMNKNIMLSTYIDSCNEYTFNDIVSCINSPQPPHTVLDTGDGRLLKFRPDLYTYYSDTSTQKSDEISSKTKEKQNTPTVEKPTGFARVGGQKLAKEILKNTVIFPKNFPEFYQGIKPEKGAILYGPPGTGKTLLAKALAEECNCHFVKIGASDMEERWVGATTKNWQNLFTELKEHQPAILFIDEADALCKKRGGIDTHGDKELNQFLKLMSDLKDDNVDVFVLLATNNINAFDKAILRDGRFGLKVQVLPPQDIDEIEEIFNIHSAGLRLDSSFMENKKEIFQKMLDMKLAGSDIEGTCKKAHYEALKRMGLLQKMETKTVTAMDVQNFSITADDFFVTLDKRSKENLA